MTFSFVPMTSEPRALHEHLCTTVSSRVCAVPRRMCESLRRQLLSRNWRDVRPYAILFSFLRTNASEREWNRLERQHRPPCRNRQCNGSIERERESSLRILIALISIVVRLFFFPPVFCLDDHQGSATSRQWLSPCGVL